MILILILTPYSAAGPFYAWCCGSMVVALMISLIYNKIFRECRDTTVDNNGKMPPTTTMKTIRRKRQPQLDASDNKRPNNENTDDKMPTTTKTTRLRRQ